MTLWVISEGLSMHISVDGFTVLEDLITSRPLPPAWKGMTEVRITPMLDLPWG